MKPTEKSLLLIVCLSLASAMCASDDGSVGKRKTLQELQEQNRKYLPDIISSITTQQPAYGANKMGINRLITSQAFTTPDNIQRIVTIFTNPKMTTATVNDAQNQNGSQITYEGKDARDILQALEKPTNDVPTVTKNSWNVGGVADHLKDEDQPS